MGHIKFRKSTGAGQPGAHNLLHLGLGGKLGVSSRASSGADLFEEISQRFLTPSIPNYYCRDWTHEYYW